jgi:branched-chain amino acid transport system ATP-binding protein
MNAQKTTIPENLKPDQDNPNPDILIIDSLCKAFGGVQAQNNISFSVSENTINALIGPNGAGKTTLFNLITGMYLPDSGRILFEGREIQGSPPHRIVSAGIARTFQNVELFESMTVIENVLVGRHVRTRTGMWGAMLRLPGAQREERESHAKAMELLKFVGLQHLAEHPSRDLPFGWQRMVEIARALAAQPRLLLLDEPAAGLNAVETAQLADLLHKINDQGITLLLVEHDMSLTMTVSDHIIVLDQGAKLAEGTPEAIQQDQAVMAAYLGQPANPDT